jgi:hypothetical protein
MAARNRPNSASIAARWLLASGLVGEEGGATVQADIGPVEPDDADRQHPALTTSATNVNP